MTLCKLQDDVNMRLVKMPFSVSGKPFYAFCF